MNKTTKGFTLIELLVVISIIVLLAAMSVPAMAGHMKQRRLKSAVWAVQMSFMEARSRAIGQREAHSLVFFVNNTSYTLKNKDLSTNAVNAGAFVNPISGTLNSIQCYDSNETSGSENYVLVENSVSVLPELITYDIPDHTSASNKNFQFTFYPDGTVDSVNLGNDKNPDASSVTPADWDIVFSQEIGRASCRERV